MVEETNDKLSPQLFYPKSEILLTILILNNLIKKKINKYHENKQQNMLNKHKNNKLEWILLKKYDDHDE